MVLNLALLVIHFKVCFVLYEEAKYFHNVSLDKRISNIIRFLVDHGGATFKEQLDPNPTQTELIVVSSHKKFSIQIYINKDKPDTSPRYT